MNFMPGENLENLPKGTFFWIMGTLVTISVVAYAGMFSVLGDRINQVDKRVSSNEQRIESVNSDIRQILVGIEQVKARLGIIESE